jgi:glycine betaine/proline transport system permease protein
MVDAATPRPPPDQGSLPALWLWTGAILVFAAFWMWGRGALPWAFDYPRAWELPVRAWIGDAVRWLVNDADFGLFTFRDLTRSIAAVIDVPYRAALRAAVGRWHGARHGASRPWAGWP